ncbi:cupin domain-containing protein [Pelomicrobium sp.]|uniref:cupin domain-containing protein n=1 Tax=Pelomicrobium sp. TaxID=2815319 RepID=UPI002FDD6E8B
MALEVERWDEARDGPLTEARLRAKMESRGYRVTRYVYPAGTYFPPHTHEVDKMDAVLSGRFRLTVMGREVVLGPGDLLSVPRGVLHEAKVLGDEPVVSLDGVKGAPEPRGSAV